MYIEACVRSAMNQDYPAERLEVLVLDGMSSDASFEIVERLVDGHSNLRLLSNPGVTQSAGWNLGIQQSRGDIIGIVSAHSVLAPDYVSRAIETYQRTGADLVGGPARADGEGMVARSIALATSTPFGVGGARFHYADREESVDTVFMGLCSRETYERIGGFDEEMVRNQDDELSYRLLKHGGRIICNPAIKSRYFSRSTLASLWSQYFQYGFWKVRVAQKHPRQMRFRQFVPPLFVASLVVTLLLALAAPATRWVFFGVASSYLLANLAASVITAARGSWRLLPILPLAFASLHLSYGAGFLVGLVRFWNKWKRS